MQTIGLIGGGNMASIHLCEDTDIDDDEIDSTVIVKMFDKPNVGDEDLQKKSLQSRS